MTLRTTAARWARLAAAALAAFPSAASAEDAFTLFQEEATVVTASRRPQARSDSPVSVEVITADEIRESGATNIWDLFRFRMGMDVLDARSADGNRAIVSVRGFPREFVGSLLVLLDGRSVYSPVSGGVYWQQIPVQLQDIERIEVARGPNTALYGSNAGLGVINIITRKPAARGAGEIQGVGGTRGRRLASGAAEDSRDGHGWRLSGTYREEGGNPSTLPADSGDFLHSDKANARGYWEPRDGTALELFGGGSWERFGVNDNDSSGAASRMRHDESFEMARLRQKTGATSDLEATVSHSWQAETKAPGVGTEQSTLRQYDADAMEHVSWLDARLDTSVGASLRHVVEYNALFFPGQKAPNNRVERAFLHQSAKATDDLALTGAVSVERSDTGGTRTDFQTAAVYALGRGHSLRAAYSRASTLPTLADRSIDISVPPEHVAGNPGIEPTTLTNYEVGHRATLFDRRLEIEENLFYMELKRMSTLSVQSITFVPQLQINLAIDNRDAAIARGAELKASYRFDRSFRAYANYAYEYVTDGQRDTAINAATPRTKVNAGGSIALGGGVSLTLNAGYKSRYHAMAYSRNLAGDFPADWRLDARVAWKATNDLELFAAGQNLTRPGRQEFPDALTIPTTVSAGFDWKIGGGR